MCKTEQNPNETALLRKTVDGLKKGAGERKERCLCRKRSS